MGEPAARVVDQDKGVKVVVGHPDQFEGDARLELDVRHVPRRFLVAPQRASGPTAARAEFGERRDANAVSQAIADRNALDGTVVFVVTRSVVHAGQVDVVEVVKAVTRVSLTRDRSRADP